MKRLISWTTATETGIDHFELQRSTNSSGGFSTIAQAAAKSAASNSYSFTDDALVNADVIYYRLKMVDQDGYSRYSYVITARQDQSSSAVTIYPNPANNRITISLSASVTDATLRITNSLGNLVFKSSSYTARV